MGCAEYRMYLNASPATADQLAHFEDITVEQEMDMAWEARIQWPLCVNALGDWDAESVAFLAGMSRIRIEVSMAGGPFIALIDGTVTNQLNAMMSEPGISMLTLVVTDDSFYLHRDETVRNYQSVPDDQIATQIFEQVSQLASTDVDSVAAASNPGHDTTVLRGTEAELLQQIAQRQHMHAYVLPGSSPGQSVGCFKRDPDPTKDFGLTPLVLTGAGRNLFRFESENPAAQTAIFQSSRINLNDRSADPRVADPSQIPQFGTDPTQGPSVQRLLRPAQADNVDNNQAVQNASQRASFVMKAHGEVMKDTYLSVLQPYQNVQLQGVNGLLSGPWLIQQVTHTLTRNSYGQTFKVIRNAQSAGANSAAPSIPAQVF